MTSKIPFRSYCARCSGERTSCSNCNATLSASTRGLKQDLIAESQDTRSVSSTFQLWDEQGALYVGIESFYHTIVVAVLAERNGREAATGELAEASFPLIRIGSFKLVSAVATAIHDNLGRHVGGL